MALPHAILDKVGWSYIGIVIGWTLILSAGMIFLWSRRQLPHLHMRRLPLVFTSIMFLHIYWTLVTLAYVIGPFVPCGLEYWFMSVLVPLGIALFQVANTQFLHIASQQKAFASTQSLTNLGRPIRSSALHSYKGSLWHRMRTRLRAMDKLTGMCTYVVLAIAVEVALTLLIYLLSRNSIRILVHFLPTYSELIRRKGSSVVADGSGE